MTTTELEKLVEETLEKNRSALEEAERTAAELKEAVEESERRVKPAVERLEEAGLLKRKS
jgi:predicted transcriptional regulator